MGCGRSARAFAAIITFGCCDAATRQTAASKKPRGPKPPPAEARSSRAPAVFDPQIMRLCNFQRTFETANCGYLEPREQQPWGGGDSLCCPPQAASRTIAAYNNIGLQKQPYKILIHQLLCVNRLSEGGLSGLHYRFAHSRVRMDRSSYGFGRSAECFGYRRFGDHFGDIHTDEMCP